MPTCSSLEYIIIGHTFLNDEFIDIIYVHNGLASNSYSAAKIIKKFCNILSCQ